MVACSASIRDWISFILAFRSSTGTNLGMTVVSIPRRQCSCLLAGCDTIRDLVGQTRLVLEHSVNPILLLEYETARRDLLSALWACSQSTFFSVVELSWLARSGRLRTSHSTPSSYSSDSCRLLRSHSLVVKALPRKSLASFPDSLQDCRLSSSRVIRRARLCRYHQPLTLVISNSGNLVFVFHPLV